MWFVIVVLLVLGISRARPKMMYTEKCFRSPIRIFGSTWRMKYPTYASQAWSSFQEYFLQNCGAGTDQSRCSCFGWRGNDLVRLALTVEATLSCAPVIDMNWLITARWAEFGGIANLSPAGAPDKRGSGVLDEDLTWEGRWMFDILSQATRQQLAEVTWINNRSLSHPDPIA